MAEWASLDMSVWNINVNHLKSLTSNKLPTGSNEELYYIWVQGVEYKSWFGEFFYETLGFVLLFWCWRGSLWRNWFSLQAGCHAMTEQHKHLIVLLNC